MTDKNNESHDHMVWSWDSHTEPLGGPIMVKNTLGRPIGQDNPPDRLLSLLTSICVNYAQTFSWYTSAKGRVWLTLKGRDPLVFSTSVECPLDAPVEKVLDALVVLFAAHIPKVQLVEPPLVTWINTKAIGERRDEAYAYCSTLNVETLGPPDSEPDPAG